MFEVYYKKNHRPVTYFDTENQAWNFCVNNGWQFDYQDIEYRRV